MKNISRFFALLLLLGAALTVVADKETKIIHFTEAEGFAECQVSCAIQDHLGYVWIGSWDGLSRYDGYRFKTFKARPGDNCPLKTNRIRWIRELDDQRLECYTADSNIYVFDRQSEQFREVKGDYTRVNQRFRPDKHLKEEVAAIPQFSNVNPNILLKDSQGGIWVRTSDGLYRVYSDKSSVEPVKVGSSNEEIIRALYVDRQSNLWVGDKDGRLMVYDAAYVLRGYLTQQGKLSKAPASFGTNVYMVFQDSKGHIWLGTKSKGLFRLAPQPSGDYTVRHYMPESSNAYSISADVVYDMVEDSRHRLWIATYWGGLNMYDLNASDDRFYNKNNILNGLPADEGSQKVHCLMITRKGDVLLIGTHDGMFTCLLADNPDKMRFYANRRNPADASSLGNNRVMDFLEDAHGNLFVATYGGGLCVTSSSNLLSEKIPFRHYLTDQGLASDICLNVVADRNGSVYVVSDMALSKLEAGDSTFTYFRRGIFDTSRFRFSEVSPVLTPDNHIVFGTTQGFLPISLDDIQKSTFVPKILFDCPDPIELSSDDKSLLVSFCALDFNKNERIVYAYKLEGINDDWVYTTENRIHIDNMPAGTYRLHVRSTNGDGTWVDNETTITIHRPAKFNETPLAWMLYGLLLAVVLFTVYYAQRYVRRLERELNELKLTHAEKISFYSERLKEIVSNDDKVVETEVEDDGLSNADREFAHRIHSLVKENTDNDSFSIEQMASLMGVSRTVLYVRMKSIFDTSPNNYVLNVRMEEAKRLLRDKDARISEVAYKVGFSDPKYFSRCFKKYTGSKPTDFQNS